MTVPSHNVAGALVARLALAVTATLAVLLIAWGPSSAAAPVAAGITGYSGVARSTGATSATSDNWSGYAVQARKTFTKVVGTWAVPTAACAGVTGSTVAALWVGLDGYQDETVEQIGIEASCNGATPGYTAWWQMWPAPVTRLAISSYPVQAGDEVTAGVSRVGQQYTLSLRSSAGWSFSTTQAGAGNDSSAEWIASSPRRCPKCRYADLTDFGRVHFSRAKAAVGGRLRRISSFVHAGGPDAITMVGSGGLIRARPGRLAVRGGRFRVAWVHE